MNNRLLLYIALCLTSASAVAQTISEGTYRLADEQLLWQQTENAAGLSHDMHSADSAGYTTAAANRGVAAFDFNHLSGDFHRVQEGNQTNMLRFFTERYQQVGRYLYGYGSFDFGMGRTKERAWSDVMRTYDSNPYISGSSIPGKYDHQDFTLQSRLATVRFGHFRYGAALRYEVGDLSRLRDPRPRMRLTDYQLTPSVTFTEGSHVVGFAPFYHRYKEKMSQPVVKQKDPHIAYYTMTGLEAATGNIGDYAGYWREYVNHEFGGELSYGYEGNNYRSVTTAALRRGTEYVYGQYKYEPGRFIDWHYEFATRHRLQAGSLLHSLEATMKFEQAYADQYLSQLITETDGAYTTQRWERTMTFRKRYQLKVKQLMAHYRLSFTDDNETVGYVGGRYEQQSVDNIHTLPTSTFEHDGTKVTFEAGAAMLGRRLWAKADLGYYFSDKADLALSPRTMGGTYAQQVIVADLPYYEASYFHSRLQLTYSLPVTLKGRTNNWYASLYGQYIKTNNELESRSAGLTIGLYY